MKNEREIAVDTDDACSESLSGRDEELTEIDEGEFYTVPQVSGNLVWSFLSVVLAIASVIIFPFFYIVGIILAGLALILAVISSRVLGFFDRMALFGIIFGIFGLVFGIFSMVLDLTGVLDGLVPQ
jgi:hypothetical protein